jgi:hypothetical protein
MCGTKGQHIVYDLPVSVTKKIQDHINEYKKELHKSDFVVELSTLDGGKYLVSIIPNDFLRNDSIDLIYHVLIKHTNRVVRINSLLLPVITSEDFLFADFGKVKMKDGRMGRKKIVFTTESYTIKFDRNGEIYN